MCLEFRRVLFRSEEHTSELQSRRDLVCRLLLENQKEHVCTPFTLGSPTPHGAATGNAECGGDHLAFFAAVAASGRHVVDGAVSCFFLTATPPPEIHVVSVHADFRF